jgi:hypothetical protein
LKRQKSCLRLVRRVLTFSAPRATRRVPRESNRREPARSPPVVGGRHRTLLLRHNRRLAGRRAAGQLGTLHALNITIRYAPGAGRRVRPASALRKQHCAASPLIHGKNSQSRRQLARRDARITFTEAVQKALEDAACCCRRTVSDVIHEMATDWAMARRPHPTVALDKARKKLSSVGCWSEEARCH